MNTHSDEWLMERVHSHLAEGYRLFEPKRVVGVFYHGAANYGVDYANSDVDTLLVVLPSYKQLLKGERVKSSVVKMPNNEQMVVKDVRDFVDLLETQSLNFLEALYTNYCYVNPSYEQEWNVLKENRENLCSCNPLRMLYSANGMAYQLFLKLEKVTPEKETVVKKYGYDPKKLHHLLRNSTFVEDYLKGKPVSECFVPDNADWLKSLKENPVPLVAARSLAQGYVSSTKERLDSLDKKAWGENACLKKQVYWHCEDAALQMVEKGLNWQTPKNN